MNDAVELFGDDDYQTKATFTHIRLQVVDVICEDEDCDHTHMSLMSWRIQSRENDTSRWITRCTGSDDWDLALVTWQGMISAGWF